MSNTDAAPAEEVEVGRVTTPVSLPPFWPENVEAWFLQVEAQFQLRGITSDVTKYNHIVTGLPNNFVNDVINILRDPPVQDKYGKLKAQILSIHSESEQKRIDRVFNEITLGDKKPSALLREIQAKVGNVASEAVIRSRFLSSLPLETRKILKVSSGSVEELARIADEILDVQPATIYAATAQPIPRANNEIADLKASIAELVLEVSSLRNSRASSRRSSPHHRRNHSRSRDRPNDAGVCWYHRRFGANASKCTKPCTYTPVSTPSNEGN